MKLPWPQNLIQRMVERDDGCIEFTGALSSQGYGLVWRDGSMRPAHRAAYELLVGPIPDGLHIDHVCHSADESCIGGSGCPHRRCVNPAHLEPVTPSENVRRSNAGGIAQRAKTHCPQGHAYCGDNLYIDAQGRRHCRSCTRAAGARHDAKRRAARCP